MKMLKKLLAVVLTGAMALTILTACGGNAVSSIAVSDKDIADALNERAKAQGENFTFTPRAKEQELARNLAAMLEGKSETDNVDEKECKNILGCKKDGANENNFVWYGTAVTDGFGVSEQVNQFMGDVLKTECAVNKEKLTDNKKTPAKIRNMGTALCKVTEEGKPLTVRVFVVTAEPVDEPAG